MPVRSHFPVRSVSISLSSGFSFQEMRRAGLSTNYSRFNLVIERLLISGRRKISTSRLLSLFQSRYRAASHFRSRAARQTGERYNRLFQSRYRAASHFRSPRRPCGRCSSVSISLSSGFSFQVSALVELEEAGLVFQSRYRAASHFRPPAPREPIHNPSFNLVIERLLISGLAPG